MATLEKSVWNNIVNKAAVKIELLNIKSGINNTSKLELYKTRKENINLNIKTYLRGIMTPGRG